jgi:sugar O-acyltransferase (sialic acid O-acetyltransferase NeuD family)
MNKILLYGASGHGKVVISVLKSLEYELAGIFDDNINISHLNINTQIVNVYDPTFFSNAPIIISIGDNKIRKNLTKIIKHKYISLKHPSSIINETSMIDIGTVLMHNSVVQANTIIGQHCIINTSAVVEHDCFISNFVHISPGACLCGNVTINEGTHVGANSTILPNIQIGKWCKIGAGAVITKNIPDNVVVVGNPGKIIKYI